MRRWLSICERIWGCSVNAKFNADIDWRVRDKTVSSIGRWCVCRVPARELSRHLRVVLTVLPRRYDSTLRLVILTFFRRRYDPTLRRLTCTRFFGRLGVAKHFFNVFLTQNHESKSLIPDFFFFFTSHAFPGPGSEFVFVCSSFLLIGTIACMGIFKRGRTLCLGSAGLDKRSLGALHYQGRLPAT